MLLAASAGIDLGNQAHTTDPLQRWLLLRLKDLTQAYDFVVEAAETRTIPTGRPLSRSAIWTALASLVLTPTLVVLTTGIGRKRFLQTAETILASILLVALIGIILGLPLGERFSHLAGAAFQSLNHTSSRQALLFSGLRTGRRGRFA